MLELRASLDATAWSGGPTLARLYGFVLTELIGANIRADADRVATCRRLVEPLAEAWRDAALVTTAEPFTAGVG